MTLQEIQKRLAALKDAGFVPSRRKGPTGIGLTLEKSLDLAESNLAVPDIGGRIELKATRKNSQSMVTLFTFNRAAWARPQKEIIEQYGYADADGRKALYSSVFHRQKNPQDLEITLDKAEHKVHLRHASGAPLATWSIYTIVGKFVSKLERLLVVLADNRQNETSGREEFWFNRAYLLENPSPENFLSAFENAQIAIDVRMHLKAGGTVRNHGTGFRIKEPDIINLYADRRKIL